MQSSINTSNRPGIPLRALLARGKVKQTLTCCALTLLCAAPAVTLAAEAEEATGPVQMQEVTVTANRREESANKVPISLSAYTQESMDIKGIKDIDDIARYTPGVTSRRQPDERHLHPRYLLQRRLRHHRHLHRRRPDPGARPRIQRRRRIAEDLRPGSRRGAARSAGHAVWRRFRGRHRPLHHHPAEPDEIQHLRQGRDVLYRRAAR